MSKNIHFLLILLGLVVFCGCETIQGAANGMQKDVQNVANPDKNGWNALQKADAWMQENLW